MSYVGADNLTLCVPRPSYSQSGTALLVESEIPKTSEDNYVLIRVDRFGFSANNVTYQALGEVSHFRYFDFHKVPESNQISRDSHGLIPVWGFGTIVWTSHKRIEVGERVYGYFAPTRYLLLPISPMDVNKYAFFVSRPHFPRDRRPYNQITRCRTDPQYNPSPGIVDLTMLYRPLFWTSFWCDDWLAASGFHGGAKNFIISSASSKTAFCLAYLIRERFRKQNKMLELKIVGLTSKKNMDFTQSLRLYDVVIEYGMISASFPADHSPGESAKWIYVDVAGNDEVNESLRSSFSSSAKENLVAHISLGLTNLSPWALSSKLVPWSENRKLLDAVHISGQDAASQSASQELPSPETFFMPEWLAVRGSQLSVNQITAMQAGAWAALLRDGRSWVQIERVHGGERVKAAYEQATRNGLGPERGYIWSMWDTRDEDKAVNAKL
ncbi:hypothetical protein ACEPAG_1316 [Sanghuangporus baumii]